MDANEDKMRRLYDSKEWGRKAGDWDALSPEAKKDAFRNWNLNQASNQPTLDAPATVETGLMMHGDEVAPTQAPEEFTVPVGQDLSNIPSGEDLRVDLSKPVPPDPIPVRADDPIMEAEYFSGNPAPTGPYSVSGHDPIMEAEYFSGNPAPTGPYSTTPTDDPIMEAEYFSGDPVPSAPAGGNLSDLRPTPDDIASTLPDFSANDAERERLGLGGLLDQDFALETLSTPANPVTSPRGGSRGRTSDGPASAYVPGSDSQYTPTPPPPRGGSRGRTSDGPDSAYIPGSDSQYTPAPAAPAPAAPAPAAPAPTAPAPNPFDLAEEEERKNKSLANPAPQYPGHYFPQGVGNDREIFGNDSNFGDKIPVYGRNGFEGYQTRGIQEKAMDGRSFRRLNPDGSEYKAPEQPIPGGDPDAFQRGYEASVARDRKIPMRTIDDNARRVARHKLSIV